MAQLENVFISPPEKCSICYAQQPDDLIYYSFNRICNCQNLICRDCQSRVLGCPFCNLPEPEPPQTEEANIYTVSRNLFSMVILIAVLSGFHLACNIITLVLMFQGTIDVDQLLLPYMYVSLVHKILIFLNIFLGAKRWLIKLRSFFDKVSIPLTGTIFFVPKYLLISCCFGFDSVYISLLLMQYRNEDWS